MQTGVGILHAKNAQAIYLPWRSFQLQHEAEPVKSAFVSHIHSTKIDQATKLVIQKKNSSQLLTLASLRLLSISVLKCI